MYGAVTGFTSPISSGKIITGSDFLKRCIRAFGCCMIWRDASLDLPFESMVNDLKNKMKSSESDSNFDYAYHSGMLKKAEEELEKLKSMNDEEIMTECIKDLEGKLEDKNRYLEKMEEEYSRYSKVLKEVELWEVPSDEYEEVKKFAIDQIEKCIPIQSDFKEAREEIRVIENDLANIEESVCVWKAKKIESLEVDIEYHKEKIENCKPESEIYASTLKFLEDFEESLKTIHEGLIG